MKILDDNQNRRLPRGTLQKRVHSVEELKPIRRRYRRNVKPLAD